MSLKLIGYNIVFLFILVVLFSLINTGTVNAATNQATNDISEICKDPNAKNSTLCNSAPQKDPVKNILVNVINIMFYAVGALSVIFIVFGGFKYVTSNGDSNKVSSAKQTLTYAIVGLIVALIAPRVIAYVISQFYN